MNDEVQCFCCDTWLKAEPCGCDPLTLVPVYDGLIFRASGNFGSTIFDPMPIGREEYLQVIICDDCIRKKVKLVTRLYNIKQKKTAEAGEFNPDR